MKAGTPPPAGPETVGTLPSVVLRGFNSVSTLAAQDAHEASDRVLLPAGRFQNLGQRRALGALHQRDDLGLLVAPLRSLAPCLAAAVVLAGLACFLFARLR